MVELSGKPGELKMTLQITRANTKQIEEVELIGYVNEEALQLLVESQEGVANGSNPFHSG